MQSESSKRIRTDYSEPIVFKGTLENCQCASWNLEDWANACGNIAFTFRSASKEIFETPRWEIDADFTSSTIRQFVDKISCHSNGCSENCGNNPIHHIDLNTHWTYSSYNYMSEIFKENMKLCDIIDWSPFGLENQNGKDSTLWIGTVGSHTPCHQDSYGKNLVAEMYGRKLWILFPPEESCNLYPTRIPYEESSVFSSVSILNPDYRRFPRFLKVKMFAVIMEPGDVLYVPPKWWHYVHCIDTAISINTWIETEMDDVNRLEEAVVRMLVTALIPTYIPQNDVWLNHNEELMSASSTGSVLSTVLEKVSTRGPVQNSKMIDFNKAEENSHSCCSVSEISQKELTDLLSKLSVFSSVKKNLQHEENGDDPQSLILKDIVNCILQPNVIQRIVNNLRN